MQPHPDIQAELVALESVLAGYPRQMPFAVPRGYFEKIPERLLEGARFGDEAVPALAGLTLKMPFTVPGGYFETLPDVVLEAALQSDLPQTSPVFSVPAGYFETLPDTFLAAAKASEAPVNVLPLPAAKPRTRTLALPALRWVAAAALIVGIGWGLYHANSPEVAPRTAQRALAALPPQALQEYVVQNLDEFDTDLLLEANGAAGLPAPSLQPKDIQAYLNAEGTTL